MTTNIYICLNALYDKNLKEGYIDIYHTINQNGYVAQWSSIRFVNHRT